MLNYTIMIFGWLAHLASHSPLNQRVNNAVGSSPPTDISWLKCNYHELNVACLINAGSIDQTMWVRTTSAIQPWK